MQHQFLKYFSFIYWELNRTFKVTTQGGGTEWRTMSVFVCAEMFIFVGLVGSVSLLVGHRILFANSLVSTLVIIAVATVSIAINRRMLRSRVQYDAEFESYPRSIRVIGCIVVLASLLGVVVATLAVLTAVRGLPK